MCVPESVNRLTAKTDVSNLEAGWHRLAVSEWKKMPINSLEKLTFPFFFGKPGGQRGLDDGPGRIKRPHAHHEPFLA